MLNLYNNGLTEIPKEIVHLPNVRELYLQDNKLKEIAQLSNLEALYLNNKELKEIAIINRVLLF